MSWRACCLLLACAGCEPAHQVYSLNGRLYDADADCLGEELVIDVIEGVPGTGCDGVLCIRSEETGDVFISAACEAPPLYEDLTDAEDGPCPAALAAHELGDDGRCE